MRGISGGAASHVREWGLLGICAAVTMAIGLPGVAQGQATGPGSGGGQPVAGPAKPVATLLNDLDDIDRMTMLNQLNLTAEQLGKILPVVVTVRADYDRKVNALGADELLKLSDEIRSTHAKSLQGALVPAQFTEKIKKIEADVLAKRDALNAENITRISGAVQSALTKPQLDTATRLAKDAVSKLGGNVKAGTDTQWLNYFVIHVIIDYPRIVDLLKDMQAARS